MTSTLNAADFSEMFKRAITEATEPQPDLYTQSQMLEAFDLDI